MKKKFLITMSVVACALLLVVGSIAGTIAYMTSVTTKVTNTFTSGNVAITLDESVVDVYGNKTTGTTTSGNTYKLIPGHEYSKDPTVHVAEGSEDCWIFVQIVDDLAAIQDADTIATQLSTIGWTLVSGQSNVYAYKETVSAGEDVSVFTSFKLKGDADVTAYAGKNITVMAYAVQADGFISAQAAWEAAPCTWGA